MLQDDVVGAANAEYELITGECDRDPVTRAHVSHGENYGDYYRRVPERIARAIAAVFGYHTDAEFNSLLLPDCFDRSRLRDTALYQPVQLFFKAVGAYPPDRERLEEWLDEEAPAALRGAIADPAVRKRFLRLMSAGGYASGTDVEHRRTPVMHLFSKVRHQRFFAEVSVYYRLSLLPLDKRDPLSVRLVARNQTLTRLAAAGDLEKFVEADANLHYLVIASVSEEDAEEFDAAFKRFVESDVYRDFLERAAATDRGQRASAEFMRQSIAFFTNLAVVLTNPFPRELQLRRLLKGHLDDFKSLLTDVGGTNSKEVSRDR